MERSFWRKNLASFHGRKISSQESVWIKTKMEQHKSIEKSFALAVKLSDEAKQAVRDDVELVGILDTMIKRSY